MVLGLLSTNIHYGYRILKYSEINPYLMTFISLLIKSNFDSVHGMSFNLMAEASAKLFQQLSISAPLTEGPDFCQFAANSKCLKCALTI